MYTFKWIFRLEGTVVDDLLVGSAQNELLLGLVGDDTIQGAGGNDRLQGGRGDDTLDGGDGDDVVLGGLGRDIAYGGDGDDLIEGADGDDTLSGGAGLDRLRGGEGDDLLDGGDGADVLWGGDGRDLLIGGAGKDRLDGEGGDDTLLGGAGRDILTGGAGADVLDGGADNDSLRGNVGDDTLDGGAGDDRVYGDEGDDTAIHVVADNAGALDTYVGGAGVDILVIMVSIQEFAALGSELAAYEAFLEQTADPTRTLGATFTFSFGLRARGFEQLEVVITTSPPEAADDTATATEDGNAVTLDVLANDTDPDETALTLLALDTTGTAGGAAIVNGEIVYTATGSDHLAEGATTLDTFTYTVGDADGESAVATVTVTVEGSNDGPEAADDAATVGEDGGAVTLDVLSNDTDADDGATLTLLAVDTTGVTGSASVVNGEIVYDTDGAFETLAEGETATETLVYTIADEHGATDIATVTVTVEGDNDAPVAQDDLLDLRVAGDPDLDALVANSFLWSRVLLNDGSAGFTDSGQTLDYGWTNFGVALGDLDGDGDLDAITAGQSYHHVLLNDGSGGFTDSGQTDMFGPANGVALVDIDGDGDLDAFASYRVWLNDGSGSFTDSGQGLLTSVVMDVALADLDGDGDLDAFAATFFGQPDRVLLNDGSGVFTDSGQSLGYSDGYGVALGDLDGDGDVDAYVDNSNNQPDVVWLNDGSGTFTDSGQTLGGSGGSDVALGDLDGDGDLDALVGTSGHQPGVLLNDGSGVFTDSGQAVGPSYSRDIVLADLDGDGDLDAYFVMYDAPDEVWLNDGSGVFTDSGQTLGVRHSWGVAFGDLDGDAVPAEPGAVEDGAPVTIAVAGLLANDSDVDNGTTLTVIAVDSTAGGGGVALQNGEIVYMADGADLQSLAEGETALDTFTYTISDDEGATDVATVSIVVTGANDGPEAADDTLPTVTVTEDGAPTTIASADLLANDTDVDNDATLTVIAVMGTAGGGSVALQNGAIVYEADGTDLQSLALGETGLDSFTYTVADEHGATDVATVTLVVAGSNDAPESAADAATVSEDGNLPLDVLANDSDVDNGSALTLVAVSGAIGSAAVDNGRIAYDTDGAFETLAVGQTAIDSFVYTVSDEHGALAVGTVAMTVEGANDAPAASDDTLSVSEDATVALVDVLANDLDVDLGNTLTVTGLDAAGLAGSASLVNGQVVYSPNGAFEALGEGDTAVETFLYTISDEHGATDVATVSIVVVGQNDAPALEDDDGLSVVAVEDGAPVTISGVDLLANDTDIDDGAALTVIAVDSTAGGGSVALQNGEIVFAADGANVQSLASGETGIDTFTYTVSDEHGATDVATVTMDVTGANDAPQAQDDLVDLRGPANPDLDVLVVSGFQQTSVWLNNGAGEFSDNGQAPAAAGAYAVALGDLDGDGDLDAFVGVFGSDQIWLNDGIGTFSVGMTLASSLTYDVALGDLDGDGDLDAFVANRGFEEVLLNDGSAGFTRIFLTDFNYGQGVALGDLDGDGDLDAFVANLGADTIWRNDGSGGFYATQFLGSASSTAVALGDLDGDGDLDAFEANGSSQADRVWLNDGSGGFSGGQSLGSMFSRGVALGDLDGDGDLDAFVVGNGPSLVWRNNGSGTFANSGQSLGENGDVAYSVALADFDGDGDLDAFVAINGVDRLWLNDGSGTFAASGQVLGPSASRDLAIGDLDGDALPASQGAIEDGAPVTIGFGDLTANDSDVDNGTTLTVVAVDTTAGGGGVAIQNGAIVYTPGGDDVQSLAEGATGVGTFTYTISDEHGATSIATVAVVVTGANDAPEANDDLLELRQGSTDIFFAKQSGNAVWLSDGNGTFADTGQGLGTAQNRSVDLGDVDGDGDLDAVVATSAGARLWLNDGEGSFTLSGQVLGTESSGDIMLGDLDGDGDLDMVVALDAAATSGNRVFLNDGSGVFTATGQQLGNPATAAVDLGDLDGDGDLDIFFGKNNGNAVFLNDGSGGFTANGQTLSSSETREVALADVDGDGDLDALIARDQGNRVLLNNGSGGFADSGQTLGASNSVHLAVGDLDGDGDIDMVDANLGAPNRVWLNNGAGTFVLTHTFGNDAFGLELADMDADGDLDVVVASLSGGANRVWLNTGQGSFSDSGQSLGVNNTRAVGLGNLDGLSPNAVVEDGAPVTIAFADLLANDTDVDDGAVLTVTAVDGTASMGQVAIQNGAIVYEANGAAFQSLAVGETALDTFTYTISDEHGATSVATVTVVVDGANDAPVATDDTATVSEDGGPATIAILDNDTDIDGTFTILAVDSSGLAGAASIVNGEVVYDTDGAFETLAEGETAVETFVYTVSDDHGATAVATLTVTVEGANDAPVAADDLLDLRVAGNPDLDAFVASIGANSVWLNDGSGGFGDSGQALGSFNSYGVALGDLDGDGDLDAFEVNGNYQPGRVWLNDGSGGFTDSGQALGGLSRSYGVALGDLDGDGDLDSFVANKGSAPANLVWLNDGNGTFTDSGQALGTSYSRDVALGDLDGDGDLDAFVANIGANHVWLNDGSGGFADSGQALGSSVSFSVALGDLDGDGDLDAFVANFSLEPNRVWLNDGSGGFTDSGQALGSSSSYDVALADLDGDGDLDAFEANNAQPDRVWLNDGCGTFTDSGLALGTSYSRDVALGDLDGDAGTVNPAVEDGVAVTIAVAGLLANDSDVDNGTTLTVIAVDSTAGGGGVALQNGEIVYAADGSDLQSLAEGETGIDTFTYTISDDEGATDVATVSIVVTGANDGPVAADDTATVSEDGPAAAFDVLLNDTDVDGGATLTLLAVDTTGLAGAASIVNGEIVYDTDGAFETLADGETATETLVYTISDEHGATSVATVIVTVEGANDGPVAADDLLDLRVAAHPDFDAFVASFSQPNRVWLNDGSGGFTDSGQALGSSNSLEVKLADLDGDGDLDAFEANYFQPSRVWLNDGSGGFTDSGQALSASASLGVALADLDGDGDVDAFVANGGQPNRVWLNDGSGGFTNSGQALGLSDGRDVALADLDGDGDVDAFVANSSGQPSRVWLNDGSGVFTDSGQALGSPSSTDVALADLDGDGDLDAFVANGCLGHRVWMNDGSGGFTDSGQTLGSGASFGVALGDLDGDGDLDAFVANYAGPDRVLLNDGSGGFTDSGQALGSFVSRDVALADVDGDGDLDAFVASSLGQPSRVWLNDGSGGFTDSGQTLGSSSSRSVVLADLDGDAVVGNPGAVEDGAPVTIAFGDLLANDVDVDSSDLLTVIAVDTTAGGGSVALQNGQIVYAADGANVQSLAEGETGIDTFTYTISDGDGATDVATVSVVVTGVNEAPAAHGDIVGAHNAVGPDDIDAIVFNDGLELWANDGSGSFAFVSSFGRSGDIGARLADFDGDGDLDMVVVNNEAVATRVLLNDGSGGFVDGVTLGATYEDVEVFDMEGDGDIDIVLVDTFNDRVEIWRNDGSAQFSLAQLLYSGVDVHDVEIFAGDGFYGQDFLVAGDSSIFRFIYDPFYAGVRSASAVPFGADEIAVSHANGSSPDLLFRSPGSTELIVVDFNSALGGSPSEITTYATGLDLFDNISIADLDGDGVDDDWVLPSTAGTVIVLNGNVAGAQVVAGASTAAVADLDGDGDVDIYLQDVSGGGHLDRVLLNDGSGGFTDSGYSFAPVQGYGVVLGSLDGDGAPTGGAMADAPFTIAATDLLANDEDPDGSPLTVIAIGAPGSGAGATLTGGTIVFDPDGLFDTLAEGETALDTFTYTVADAFGATASATVTVQVHGVNDAPEANDDLLEGAPAVEDGAPVTIAFADLLANDTDVDNGAELTVTAVGASAAGAGVTLGSGGIVYEADASSFQTLAAGETALDTFSYTVSDEHGATSVATVTIVVDGSNDAPEATDDVVDLRAAAIPDIDAFVAGFNQSNVVWLNNGSGGFTNSNQALGATRSQGVALADLDGDGDLDAFEANGNNQPNRVWLNNGSGGFADSGQTLGTSYSMAVALADLDGDGDIDAFVANLDQPDQVWLNDGSGGFTDSGQALGASRSHDVALADLDGDGDLDAFVANGGTQGEAVWLNDGSGGFTDSGQTLGASNSYGVQLGDLDGDGDLDAFVANTNGEADRVWLNDGSGTFTDSSQALGSSAGRDVALGDVDGDGDLDAFVANTGNQPNRVWLNDGSGVFSDSGQALGSSSTDSVALADLDADGDLDAFESNINQAARVWLNDGSGGFAANGQTLSSIAGREVALGDLDGDATPADPGAIEDGAPVTIAAADLLANDGDVDNGDVLTVIAVDSTAGGGSVAIQNGEIVYAADGANAQALAEGETGIDTFTYTISDGDGATAVATVSVVVTGSNDGPVAMNDVVGAHDTLAPGDADAIVVTSDGLELWTNNGSGFLTLASSFGLEDDARVALGDLDGDGDLDLAVVNDGSGGNRVLLNDGSGGFVAGAGLGGPGYDVELFDMDGDGDLDIGLIGTYDDNSYLSATSLWRNDGSAGFTLAQTLYAPGRESLDLEAFDLDGDDDLELVVATRDQLSVFTGNAGTFSLHWSASGGFRDVEAVENGGPFADLLLIENAYGLPVHIWDVQDLSSPPAIGRVEVPTGIQAVHAIVADLDGDGFDDDWVLTHPSGTTIRLGGSVLYEQDVAGAADAAVADLDGDGDLDILLLDTAGGLDRVLINDGAGTFADSGFGFAPATGRDVVLGDLDGDSRPAGGATEDAPFTIAVSDLLANDVDPDSSLSVTGVGLSGSGAGVTLVGGSIIVDPDGLFESLAEGETAHDSFTYTVADDHGATSVATVTVVVNGVNDAPATTDDSATVAEDGAVTIDVLANDTDVDAGASLTVLEVEGSGLAGGISLVGGQVVYNAAGAWNTLGAGETAVETFTYVVQDDAGAVGRGTVTVTVEGENDAPVVGSDHFLGAVALPDIVGVHPGLTSGTALLNNGPAGFDAESVSLGFTYSSGVALGDLDGDGADDIVVFASGGTRVMLNDGSGSFAANGQTLVAGVGDRDQLGDLDGDGDLDILVSTTGGTRVLLNDGTGQFSSGALFGRPSTGVAIADLDGDGDLDALAVSTNSFPFFPPTYGPEVWLNDGSGGFAFGQAVGTNAYQRDVTLGDIDGDGDIDGIVSATGNPGHVRFLVNNGAGSFSYGQNIDLVNVVDVVAGDIDGDGDLDVIAVREPYGSFFAVTTRLLINDGSGTFTARFDAIGAAREADLVDIDGDGDLDLVAADGSSLLLFENDPWLYGGSYQLQFQFGVTLSGAGSFVAAGELNPVTPLTEDDLVTIAAAELLAHASDPDQGATLSILDGPGVTVIGGDVVFDPAGSYDHLSEGESEAAVFTYTVSDEHGATDTGTVTVVLVGANDAPVANDDVADGSESLPFLIDVLSNDDDPDASDVLTLVSVDTAGTTGSVAIFNGEIFYDPAGQFDGLGSGATQTDSFTYTIVDDEGVTSTATVEVTIHGHEQGSGGNDVILGTAFGDLIDGGSGADDLSGSGGDDRLLGGADDDVLRGGLGVDLLDGGPGVDVLEGGGADGVADFFVFRDGDAVPNSGTETIADFEQGFDLIDLIEFGLTGFGDLTIVESGGNSEIQIDVDDRVIVEGVTGLTSDDFLF